MYVVSTGTSLQLCLAAAPHQATPALINILKSKRDHNVMGQISVAW